MYKAKKKKRNTEDELAKISVDDAKIPAQVSKRPTFMTKTLNYA